MGDNEIRASIDGKGYQIRISYDSPVNDIRDLYCNCSCPDDRGGWCKHICAVLTKFVDDQPQRKRVRQDAVPPLSIQHVASLKRAVGNLNRGQLVEIVNAALDCRSPQLTQHLIAQKVLLSRIPHRP